MIGTVVCFWDQFFKAIDQPSFLTPQARACPEFASAGTKRGAPSWRPFLGARVGKHKPSPQNCHPEQDPKKVN
jgi:hypothetical protein